jgi:Type I restriction enzyme R protein N terminus (HSDR_N)
LKKQLGATAHPRRFVSLFFEKNSPTQQKPSNHLAIQRCQTMLLELDYLSLQSHLRITRNAAGDAWVFDPIRKKNVVLLPEEWLRQLVLRYLLDVKNYPATRIRSEVGITVNGMPRRCDIVVFDAALQPWLIVECKSPKVPLTQKVMEQAARYNLQLRVPYLAITNGLATCCCALDHETAQFDFLPDFPDFE